MAERENQENLDLEIRFRATPAFRDRWEAEARRRGLVLSQFIRSLLNAECDRKDHERAQVIQATNSLHADAL